MDVIPVVVRGSERGLGGGQISGFRTASALVLVIEQGRWWVTSQDGSRFDVNSPAIVVFGCGEWVEYGSVEEGGEVYLVDYYGLRESSVGFHPCGPPEAPRGEPPA